MLYQGFFCPFLLLLWPFDDFEALIIDNSPSLPLIFSRNFPLKSNRYVISILSEGLAAVTEIGRR